MSKRREGREAAMQLLYSRDNVPKGTEHDLAAFWDLRRTDETVRAHATSLFKGVLAHLPEIDARITAALQNFSFDRLAAVDRDILRLAVYEMNYETSVPPVVAMNEAIEIAKRFGGEDSSRFVNGVLDRLIKEVKRDLRSS
jgi:transcription antitermination protein NusB